MARKSKDVFGFDELAKTFDKMKDRYDDEAEALLAAETRQVKKRVKQQTPVSNKKHKGGKDKPLKQTWKEKKPKEYQNGKYVVGMVHSDANHAHLYELGHDMIVRSRTRDSYGRYTTQNLRTGKVEKLSLFKRKAFGVKKVGYVPGHRLLANTLKELESKVLKDAEKLMDKITKDVQI